MTRAVLPTPGVPEMYMLRLAFEDSSPDEEEPRNGWRKLIILARSCTRPVTVAGTFEPNPDSRTSWPVAHLSSAPARFCGVVGVLLGVERRSDENAWVGVGGRSDFNEEEGLRDLRWRWVEGVEGGVGTTIMGPETFFAGERVRPFFGESTN